MQVQAGAGIATGAMLCTNCLICGMQEPQRVPQPSVALSADSRSSAAPSQRCSCSLMLASSTFMQVHTWRDLAGMAVGGIFPDESNIRPKVRVDCSSRKIGASHWPALASPQSKKLLRRTERPEH